jgi:hypothetical protein
MTNLTYSELVYMFADKAVSDRSGLVNYDSHPSGQKISVKPLSQKMVLAAFVYLIENSYISLTIKDVKKLFFIPSKAVFAKKCKDAGTDVTGIEKILLHNFKEETEVSKAVYWLLNDDETSPWGQVIVLSKNSLVEKGFLELEKERKNIFSTIKYLYVENKKDEMTPTYNETEKKLSEFSKTTEGYSILEQAVKSGIASRKEQSSSSD